MRNAKKILKGLLVFCTIGILLLGSSHMVARAGFGDYNDYDSGGSDWGGDSDWGDSDWGDSSWDDGYYSSSGSSSDGGGTFSTVITIAVVAFIIIYSVMRQSGSGSKTSSKPVSRSVQNGPKVNLPDRTTQIAEQIKTHDPLFTAPDFISFVKQVYLDIQDAWCKRDLEPVRPVLHQNLYQQTERQIQKKIADGIVNHLDRISVNTTYLTSYRIDSKYEYLTVYLAAQMIDYQVKEATGEVILGDKNTRWSMYYKMTFMRSADAKTRTGEDKTKGMICPNCGAPLTGTSFGKCEYCGSIVTTGAYDWVLSDFGVIKNDTKDDGIVINK